MSLFRIKPMRIVRQKQSADCAICCLSMLTGKAHSKVIKQVGCAWEKGEGLWHTSLALQGLGFDWNKDFEVIRKPQTISPEYFREQVWGRRALLSVPSLNYEGKFHMLYWHYNKLYDPSKLKTYKNLEETKPTEIVIFNEGR